MFKLLSFSVCLSTFILPLLASTTLAVPSKSQKFHKPSASDPGLLCFIQTQDQQVRDLSYLCGASKSESAAPDSSMNATSTIDPAAQMSQMAEQGGNLMNSGYPPDQDMSAASQAEQRSPGNPPPPGFLDN